MQIKDITDYLEQYAPLSFQESYDNSGLLVGDKNTTVSQVLISLDVTDEVIDEAIAKGCNLIIAHHPLIFKGLKSLTGKHWVERCVIKAIRHNIALYAIHTNLDHVHLGVNRQIADQLGLMHQKILDPKKDTLSKIVTFVPSDAANHVLNALYAAGAGSIGAYDRCSFQVEGIGTFRPGENTNPYIGKPFQDESASEKRLELIFPTFLSNQIIAALKSNHPYEEVAHYITPIANSNQEVGSGMVGLLAEPMTSHAFLTFLKDKMNTECIRHTAICKDKVQKIALCGGAGSFLLEKAISSGADVFVTSDYKYHDFFEADGRIIVADIGHYESEQFTKDLLFDILSKKFTNIALLLTEVQTNPIKYL